MKGSGPPSSAQPAFVACLQSRTKATCGPSGLGLCCGGRGDLNSGACPAPISGNPDPAGQRVRALVTRCSQHFLQGTIRTFFFYDTATTEIYTLSLHDARSLART